MVPYIDKSHEGSKASHALVLAVAISCNLGGIGTPIGSPPNAIAIGLLAEKGINIGFLEWMLLTIPMALFLIIVSWKTLSKFYGLNETKPIKLNFEDIKWTFKHNLSLSIFALTVFLWIFGFLFGISSAEVFAVAVIFSLGLLDDRDFRKLPWDILFLISGGLCLGLIAEKIRPE